MEGARVAVPAGVLLAECIVNVCVVMVVKRWSGGGGEKRDGAWAHGWHLDRVLKVGTSGLAQRRQKCLPIALMLGKRKGREGKTHAWLCCWPELLRQIVEDVRTLQGRVCCCVIWMQQ